MAPLLPVVRFHEVYRKPKVQPDPCYYYTLTFTPHNLWDNGCFGCFGDGHGKENIFLLDVRYN